MVKKFN